MMRLIKTRWYYLSTILVFFVFMPSVFAQTKSAVTDHFRSASNGIWKYASTWESSVDSINWFAATIAPDKNSSSIVIRSGHQVTLDFPTNVNQMIIEQNATLILKEALVLYDDIGYDLIVKGTIQIESAYNLVHFPSTSSILVCDGGLYMRICIGSAPVINTCTWAEGSTAKIISPITLYDYVSGLNQQFYNFIWEEHPDRTYNCLMKMPDGFTVNGTAKFKVNHNLSLTDLTSPINYYFNGDVIIEKGIVKLCEAPTGNVTMHIAGNLTIGSTSNTARLGVQPNNKLIVKGNINSIEFSSGVNSHSSLSGGTIIYAKTSGIQTISTENIRKINHIVLPGVSLSLPNIVLETGFNFTISDNASVITPANLTATVERNLVNAEWNTPLDGWQMISSPVNAQPISGSFTLGSYDFYAWDEVTGIWLNKKDPTNYITSFQPGEGYFAAYDDGGLKSFSGILNKNSIIFNNLSYTGSHVNSGYHLLGNPFPSGLDWSNSSWNRLNISNVAMIWNEQARNYLPITEANPVIPPCQGFFVQALNEANHITIPAEARVHCNSLLYKLANYSELRIRVSSVNNESFDETVISLNDESIEGLDVNDGRKMVGSEYSPQLYTVTTHGEKLAVNSLCTTNLPSVIKLNFIPGYDKNYAIKSIDSNVEADFYLQDRKTGIVIPLNDTPYHFTANIGDDDQRFTLYLKPYGIAEDLVKPTFMISYESGEICIVNVNSLRTDSEYDCVLTSAVGNIVLRTKVRLSDDNTAKIKIPQLAAGIYLFTVRSVHQNQHTIKLFIN